MTSMHVRRSRKARAIELESETRRKVSGKPISLEDRPASVLFALLFSVFLVIFAAALTTVLVTGHGLGVDPYNPDAGDQTVGVLVTSGILGLFSPFLWWMVITEIKPPESAWHHPLRAAVRGLAFIASPDDSDWRTEWPGLLVRAPGSPRQPVRTTLTVLGWVWSALRSRAGWLLDVCLESDAVCALATFSGTSTVTLRAWETAGIGEAVVAAVTTFLMCVAAVDGLCRWRGIKLPRKSRKPKQ